MTKLFSLVPIIFDFPEFFRFFLIFPNFLHFFPIFTLEWFRFILINSDLWHFKYFVIILQNVQQQQQQGQQSHFKDRSLTRYSRSKRKLHTIERIDIFIYRKLTGSLSSQNDPVFNVWLYHLFYQYHLIEFSYSRMVFTCLWLIII